MITSHNSPNQIPYQWRLPVRLAWLLVAGLMIAAYLWTLPAELARQSEFKPASFSGEVWSQVEIASSTQALGVSPFVLGNITKYADILLPAVYYVIGIFIFLRRSDDRIAYLASLLFVSSLSKLSNLVSIHPFFAILSDLHDSFSTILMLTLFLIFPDGRFVPPWTRWVAGYSAAVQVWRLFFPAPYMLYAPLLVIPSLIAVAAAQIIRYRHVATPAQRQQVKWVIFGMASSFGCLGLVFLSYALFPGLEQPGPAGLVGYLAGSLVWELFLIVFPLSFTLAILRSRLFDIDVIIRRTLLYTLLTAVLILIYFGGVILLQNLFVVISGQRSVAAIVISTLLIAALFNPLRQRSQDFIDSSFYRKKYNAQLALENFAEVTRAETDLSRLSAELVELVQEAFQPDSLSLWLADVHPGRTQDLLEEAVTGL